MKKWRLRLSVIVALLALPPIWVRSPAENFSKQVLLISPLEIPARGISAPAALTVTGLSELTSPNTLFGGYSAMLTFHDGRLRAFSDRGSMITFAPNTQGTPQAARLALVAPEWLAGSWLRDIESVTRDEQTGGYWLGYEDVHAIRRFDVASSLQKTARPLQMRGWPVNGGAEAMVRLPDGQFLILPENDGPALLFPSDPVEGATAITFTFRPPAGSYPVDLANLPDGRILILTRALSWTFPPFSSRLLIADPRTIREGEELQWEQLAALEDILPRENYEGMAAVKANDGGVIIWLISDDNQSAFQRTLLARLHYSPASPAHDTTTAPDTKKRAKP